MKRGELLIPQQPYFKDRILFIIEKHNKYALVAANRPSMHIKMTNKRLKFLDLKLYTDIFRQ